MLAQRLRRWANIKPTLLQRIVFAGLSFLMLEFDVLDGNLNELGIQCRFNIGPRSATLASIETTPDHPSGGMSHLFPHNQPQNKHTYTGIHLIHSSLRFCRDTHCRDLEKNKDL